MNNTSGRKPFALEDLIELNDEIAALIRAGIPLELGLRGLEGSVSSRLSELTHRLAVRLSGGSSLSDALAAETHRLPAVYRALVEIGAKTGRLPEALESLSELARSALDLRRRITLAALYPAIVLAVAYNLFVGVVAFLVPQLIATYHSLRLTAGWMLDVLDWLHQTLPLWGPLVPVAAIVLFLGWSVARSFSGLRMPGAAADLGMFGWLPGLRVIVGNLSRANFADLLAMLVEHSVPLPAALNLAAESTGDALLVQAAHRLSMDVAGGRSLAHSLPLQSALPPFMRWMIGVGELGGSLAAALRQTADVYRRRALNQAEWFKVVLPVALVLLIGGGATAAYAFIVFAPFADLLGQLGLEQF